MSWSAVTDHESGAIQSLAQSDDRTIAIIAATIVEARLRMVLENSFQRDDKIEEQFFNSTGPLGMFSNKIDLALLLGLVSKEAWRDLKTMKDIRNKFAHKLEVKDFQSQQIGDWCKNFTLIEKHFEDFGTETKNPHGLDLIMHAENLSDLLQQARWRYLLTAQLFSTALLFPKGNRVHI